MHTKLCVANVHGNTLRSAWAHLSSAIYQKWVTRLGANAIRAALGREDKDKEDDRSSSDQCFRALNVLMKYFLDTASVEITCGYIFRKHSGLNAKTH